MKEELTQETLEILNDFRSNIPCKNSMSLNSFDESIKLSIFCGFIFAKNPEIDQRQLHLANNIAISKNFWSE